MAIKPRPSQDSEFSQINVIPLVDIILVVLIIFMVIAPLVMRDSIGLKLPKGASDNQSQKSQLEVIISESGQIKIHNELVDLEQLKQILADEFRKKPELQLTISADQRASHGNVVTVLDAVGELGIKEVGITVDKKSSP